MNDIQHCNKKVQLWNKVVIWWNPWKYVLIFSNVKLNDNTNINMSRVITLFHVCKKYKIIRKWFSCLYFPQHLKKSFINQMSYFSVWMCKIWQTYCMERYHVFHVLFIIMCFIGDHHKLGESFCVIYNEEISGIIVVYLVV